MSLKLLAIDLGKRSFHCYGIDSDGVIISRKTSRFELLETINELAPETIAMEACASAHFWGRRFLADGRRVLLINPRFVKPFVKGSKNDAADAEGIYEAALRPTMRFVPVKSTDNRICNPYLVHGSALSALELRSSIICGGFSVSMASFYPKVHGGFWRRRRTPSRPPSSPISRGSSSATCSTNSALSKSPAREAGSAALEALPDKRSLSAALQTTRRRPCDRNGARRRGGRRPSFPLRTGTCGVDWPRAASIYDRRQTSARRDWKARQSLSPTSDDSWCPRRHVSFSQTRR
jgi:hypothetical protein